MDQQLQRILKTNLENIDKEVQFNQQKIEGFQDFFVTKAKQLTQLQNCFMKQIKELQNYQKRETKFKNIIKMVMSLCNFCKSQLYTIKSTWQQFIIEKQTLQNKLRQLPSLIFNLISTRLQINGQTQNQRSDHSNKKRQNIKIVEIANTQYRYQQQIQKLRGQIINLEKQLRRKSQNLDHSNNKIKQDQCNQKKPVNLQNAKNQHQFLLQQLHQIQQNTPNVFNETLSNPNLTKSRINQTRQKSVTKKGFVNSNFGNNQTPTKQQEPIKMSNSKIYFANKSRRLDNSNNLVNNQNNNNIAQFVHTPIKSNKSFNGTNIYNNIVNTPNQSYKKYQIPLLPELKLNLAFVPPIMNGFDILAINGKQVYKGMWRKGMFEGRGKLFTDTWVYDGEFKNGIIDGMGSLNFKTYTFIGKFMNGNANGQGTLYSRDKPITGIWKDNILLKLL